MYRSLLHHAKCVFRDVIRVFKSFSMSNLKFNSNITQIFCTKLYARHIFILIFFLLYAVTSIQDLIFSVLSLVYVAISTSDHYSRVKLGILSQVSQ